MPTLHVSGQPGVAALIYLINLAFASLLACGLALAMQRLLARRPLPLRHLILFSGLVVVLVSPLLVGVIQSAGFSLLAVAPAPARVAIVLSNNAATQTAAARLGSPGTRSIAGSSPSLDRQSQEDAQTSRGPAGIAQDLSQTKPAGETIDLAASVRSTDNTIRSIFYLFVAIWIAGSCYQFIRLAGGIRVVREFLRSASALDEPRILRIAADAASMLGLKFAPAVKQSADIEAPLSVGVFRPLVVLPAQRCDWSDRQWLSLLVHEMAHIRRRDLIIGIVQRAAVALYWWNPLVRRASSALSLLREQICDDLVSQHVASCDGYVDMLVDLASRIVDRRLMGAALGAVDGSAGELSRRVSRLLETNRPIATSLDRRMVAVGLSVAGMMLLSLAAVGVHVAGARASAISASKFAAPGDRAAAMLDPSGAKAASSLSKKPLSPLESWEDFPGGVRKPKPPHIFPSHSEDNELAGVVVDERGAPLSGVKVAINDWVTNAYHTTTDQQGRFRLRNLGLRSRPEVEFTKAGYDPSLFIAKPTGSADWTIVLTQGTGVEGMVTDPQGRPVAGARVRAFRGPFFSPVVQIESLTTETRTDSAGHYRLLLEPDQYYCDVRVPGVGVIQNPRFELAAKEMRKLDFHLAPGPPFQATVRDSITGKPVKGFVLKSIDQPDIHGTSDENGVVKINDLFERRYELWVSGAGNDGGPRSTGTYARWWCPSGLNKRQFPAPDDWRYERNFDSLRFDVRTGDPPAEIIAEPAVTIKGRLLDPEGQPVAQGTVAISATGRGWTITGDNRYRCRSDKNGRYVLRIPASDVPYHLIGHDGAYDSWRKWANAVSKPMRTKPGQLIDGLDLRLTRPGVVVGRAVDAAGRPRARQKVYAYSADGNDNFFYSPVAITDASGRYKLQGIAEGDQYIEFGRYRQIGDKFPKPTDFGKSVRLVNVVVGAVIENVDFVAE